MTPPRLTERLLRAFIRNPQLREGILDDLAEEWEARARRDGARAANRWYRREALRTVPHVVGTVLRIARREEPRAAIRTSSLDVKLGLRMLVKHPGLTIVGGLAIAISVAIGGAWFEFAHDYFSPTMPLPEGDRIVGIHNWNTKTNAADNHVLHDFDTWRAQLKSVRDVGAFRLLDRNLVTDDGRAEPVAGVEISASMFRVTRVPPLLGRPLVDADEQLDAPPVVVIGYSIWQSRFGGREDVIGRKVRVGIERRTIVGVMPEGFAFPVQQRLWAPLRIRPTDFPRGHGPLMTVFGRLAPGASLQAAQAEIEAIGRRAAADFPATNARLQPRVQPYIESLMRGTPMLVYLMQTFFLLILVIACANVATLVFARTVTREREIAVRRALGASRGRIITQMFVEALLLASVGAAIGLVIVWTGQTWGMNIFWGVQGGTDARPFWWDTSLSLSTVLYVGGLSVLGAALVGILPALRATRVDVQSVLQESSANGSGLRFGVVSTGVIVVQVALSVLVLPDTVASLRDSTLIRLRDLPFAPSEYLSVRVEQDQGSLVSDSATMAFRARFKNAYGMLVDRLRAQPGVLGVTAATKLPATDPTDRPSIEIDGGAMEPVNVNTSSVDLGLFKAFNASPIFGRDFDAADVAGQRPVAIVNESFVHDVLGGRNAIGRRVRFAARRGQPPNPWLEIVGVVPDLAMNAFEPGKSAGLYQPLSARAYPVQLAVHVRGDAKAFAPQLRQIAAAIDPTLRLYAPKTLEETLNALAMGAQFFVGAMAAIAVIALALSAVGIYSLMSFTVSQRTREIGIRTALGADGQSIARHIVWRALKQVSIGAAVGVVGALFTSEHPLKENARTLAGVVALILIVSLVACYGPLRRALRVQPTDALRAG